MPTEFQFIEDLRKRFGRPNKRVVTGIGDDAAIISQNSRRDMVVSSDMLVEGIDFKLDWTAARNLGHKALAISLSDIAAMGAKPLWSTVSIALPEVIWSTDFLKEFYEGWAALAEKYGVDLVGGDISKSPDKVVIDSVVGGEVRKGRAVKRSTARPGDLIYVSGELGGAAAGLKILMEDAKRGEFSEKLIKRQLMPEPRCTVGQTLGEFSIATAMIDISDGLSSDLMHICEESGVGARIFQDKLPVDKDLKAANFPDKLNLVLNGGEDFELLFTVPRRLKQDLRNKLAKLPVTQIGEITENRGEIEFHGAGGISKLEPAGFRHF